MPATPGGWVKILKRNRRQARSVDNLDKQRIFEFKKIEGNKGVLAPSWRFSLHIRSAHLMLRCPDNPAEPPFLTHWPEPALRRGFWAKWRFIANWRNPI